MITLDQSEARVLQSVLSVTVGAEISTIQRMQEATSVTDTGSDKVNINRENQNKNDQTKISVVFEVATFSQISLTTQ